MTAAPADAIWSGIRSLDDPDFDVAGKRVFLRLDLNVPLDGSRIADDTRIREALPTIRHLIEKKARVLIGSHLGRPGGKPDPALSLEPVGLRLAEALGMDVILTDDCIGDGARKLAFDLREGEVLLLENLRFHAGEEEDDVSFARDLARLAEAYVNDAFGVSHRANASVTALPRLLDPRGVGFLMRKEIGALGKIVTLGPEGRPFAAVLGGAKVSDKIGVLEALLDRAQILCIGGAMANTFLAAKGLALGKSRVETDRLPVARDLLRRAEKMRVEILLPKDLVVASGPDAPAGERVAVDHVPADAMALDVGPDTVAAYRDRLLRAQTIFWNGPMGVFEKEPFRAGTMGVARAIAESGAYAVVGGGDSVAAVERSGLRMRFAHVSTGGGAALELIEGKKLPGIEALRSR